MVERTVTDPPVLSVYAPPACTAQPPSLQSALESRQKSSKQPSMDTTSAECYKREWPVTSTPPSLAGSSQAV